MSLRVDESGRFLRRDGKPWFLLGDTAWELLHRLDMEETEHYLRTRAGQGFNTVLVVALAEFDGLTQPNAGGDLPFRDLDPRQPNDPYWHHADEVIERANALGLTVGLLPTWGRYWSDEHADGRPFFDADSAAAYATWIAHRYGDADLIWVLGGDRRIATAGQRAVIEAFAGSIRKVVGDSQAVTFHPRGHASSSDDLADAGWLDFDMIQSSHTGWNTPNYQLVEQDYRSAPLRPTLDAEPNYENHPVMTPSWEQVPGWRFDHRDVRRSAYHAVFAGACGHVYGCHDIWQFFDPERNEAINGANLRWRSALELAGAEQMRHLAALVEELGLLSWQPDQSVLAGGIGFLGGHQRALSRDSRIAVYTPQPRPIRLDLPAGSWTVRQWDPVTGGWSGAERQNGGRFTVRVEVDHDAVVVLERA